jgi:hypothetical protein
MSDANGLTGDRFTRVVIPHATHCCGDCKQGRRPCQCPEACELPEPDEQSRRLRALIWRLYLAVLLVGIGWGLAHLLPTP